MAIGLDTINAIMSEDAFAAVRAHPAFFRTAERLAKAAREKDVSLDPDTRWLTKDLGRISVYISALIVHATYGRVSAHDLATLATANKSCSRGRVLAFIDYAHQAGRLSIPPGQEHWTRRPLNLHPSFFEYGLDRFWAEMDAAAEIAPEAALALEHKGDPRGFSAALVVAGALTVVRADLFFGLDLVLKPFLERHAGMQILHDWLQQQVPGRRQLLETAPLNRAELSRRHRISRAHLNQLLADTEAAGLLSLPSPERLVFSRALSDDLERHFAFSIQMSRLSALAVLEACTQDSSAGLQRRVM